MSLLVATVGIVNSMLMAVTERYKEIGTMKCLGALDTFIVRLFLLESGILGLIGAAVGAGVGYVGVSLVHMVRFGPKVWSHVGPALLFGGGAFSVSLPVAVVGAVILGALLALLAAIYPAWRASLMPPAAALRVEI
jgi:ABC-type antimicrobial peptide transport system permease subunit